MPIRIILVDDHALLREGVAGLLDSHADFAIVGSFGDGRAAIEFAASEEVDVAVVDVAMPDMNGIEVVRLLQDASPPTQILMLSAYVDPEYVYLALRAGAQGYIAKDSAGRVLADAVRTVHAGKRYLCDQADTEALRHVLAARGTDTPLGRLSHREREVLQWTVEGCSIAETAKRLGISPKSVETYRSRVLTKLGIGDLPALVKFAIRHGVTSSE